MANPFETVILNLRNIGAFQFLFPFIMTTAIFYGLLRKSQILGEPRTSTSINGTVALVAAFMVWAAPILMGVDIETHLAAFFVQGISVTLVVMVGLMIVGMFAPPNLPDHFKAVFKEKPQVWMAILVGGILVGAILAVSSGLINIYFPEISGGGGLNLPALSEETIATFGVFLLLAVTVVGFVALS